MESSRRGVARWMRQVLLILTVLTIGYSDRALAQICVGDCDENNLVRVNELIIGVNIALDRVALSQCESFDANGSLAVEVNELVQGVNNALRGCPALPPSPTPSNTTAPTNTPPSTATSTATATELATATATLTVTAGTATPTVEEETPTPTFTIDVGTATPTGTVEESTPTPTFTVDVGTATPTGTVEENSPTPTATELPTSTAPVGVNTATPTATSPNPTSTSTALNTATSTPTVPAPTSTRTPTTVAVGSPTPTATATQSGEEPTAPPAARFAGSTTVVVNALGVIPTLLGAVANGIDFGGASAGGAAGVRDDGGFGAAACPGGGTATRTGSLFPGLNLNVTLTNCRVATVDGFVTFNGKIVQVGTTITVNDGNGTPGPLTAQFEDNVGADTLLAEAQLTLTVSGIPALGGSCDVTSLTVATNGTISTTTSNGASATITFTNTGVVINMIVFSPSCVPTQYRLTFNQTATLLSSASDSPISVTFNALVIDVNDSVDPATFSVSGGMTSPCFGGAATVSTQAVLQLPDDEVCPSAGQITAATAANTTRITYNADDSVGLDTNNDGTVDETYPSCQDPRLYECLA